VKKTFKRILLTIAVIFALLIAVGLYSCAPMLAMKPTPTGQILNTNIYAVKNSMATVHFIKTDDGYIMIDAGLNPKKAEASLKEIGISPNDVKWIFLTHSDGDHVSALASFPSAEIHMSEDELPLINGTAKRSPFGGNKLPAGVNINKINLLSDNQELSLGQTTVKAIKAPGHTSGTMLYLVDNQHLFTGDAFKITKGNIGIHPFTTDKKLTQSTIKRLKGVIEGSSLVLTSHYGYYEVVRGFK
jgi:glyoxylase-like metal-dependent hydrolase (beta-lactamase superfamily II)